MTFITNLPRAGVSPKTAQTLARHSDINLTMNTYTMLSVHDQASAVEMLPPIPTGDQPETRQIRATGTDGPETSPRLVPTIVPRGAKNGAIRLASNEGQTASDCTEERQMRGQSIDSQNVINPEENGACRADSQESASKCTNGRGGTRTRTPFRTRDSKSRSSANSDTRPNVFICRVYRCFQKSPVSSSDNRIDNR